MFRAVLRDAARTGGVLVGAGGALAWIPTRNLHGGVVDQIARGYAAIPLHLGLRATFLLQAHEAWCAKRLAAHASPCGAYIYSVGVEPELAGKGIGSRLVRLALERIGERYAQCALRTDEARNVRFYEKLGFRCVEHAVVPATGLPCWFFVQSTAPSTAEAEPAPTSPRNSKT